MPELFLKFRLTDRRKQKQTFIPGGQRRYIVPKAWDPEIWMIGYFARMLSQQTWGQSQWPAEATSVAVIYPRVGSWKLKTTMQSAVLHSSSMKFPLLNPFYCWAFEGLYQVPHGLKLKCSANSRESHDMPKYLRHKFCRRGRKEHLISGVNTEQMWCRCDLLARSVTQRVRRGWALTAGSQALSLPAVKAARLSTSLLTILILSTNWKVGDPAPSWLYRGAEV